MGLFPSVEDSSGDSISHKVSMGDAGWVAEQEGAFPWHL